MTYSLVARDPASGALGVAVASRFFAVGAIVPWVRGGVGAVASQAFPNPTYGVDALRLLADGAAPEAIVTACMERDTGHPHRQLHLVDARGRTAAFTGLQCIDWAGHAEGDGVSVAGNMLAGPKVVAEALRAYRAALDRPFAERLLLALQAGEDAGGDKRGRQSAALVIHRDQDYPWLDIRADDHADPIAELRRLYAVAQERFLIMAEAMPTRENPHGLADRSGIDARIARLEEDRRRHGETTASHMWNRP
ncbi:MAG: DUF1028 domain-containing protein [Alphaproteobacteria bacterium]|nr:DUF1028 domain-containing protein [Alphaproteobacteria bacterium]MCB9931593.1 DUF1028 domain-containing protein [Alphaproteobacteria bacterium]